VSTRPFGLTDRQVEILELLAEGLSSAQVCKRLFIADDTLKSHLYKAAKRMGCGDRAHMIAKAYQSGVLRIPDAELMRQANELVERIREQRLEKVRADLLRQHALERAA
jgi:DNA-binding CsgD family transcriptional regulator